MSWFLFYILCGIAAAAEMGFILWWEMKKDPDETLSLSELLVGVFLAICPILNTIIAGLSLVYLFAEVFPKIVLFGGKK